jgi:hypothetical protein
MSTIQLNDIASFQALIDRYDATLSQVVTISQEINSEFDKIGYGEMWNGIAQNKAVEKERYIRTSSSDIQAILKYKLDLMRAALNGYLELDKAINDKINGSKK